MTFQPLGQTSQLRDELLKVEPYALGLRSVNEINADRILHHGIQFGEAVTLGADTAADRIIPACDIAACLLTGREFEGNQHV